MSSLHVVGCPFLALASVFFNPAAIDGISLYENYYGKAARQIKITEELPEIAKPIEFETFNVVNSKKNVVFLYVESLERTFFNENLFPGLMQGLKALEKEATSFQGLMQAPMTGWTIAGMTASQCGIPLSTFEAGRNRMGERERFLPGATCIGDLLKYQEYQLVFIGGADKNFAGKDRFYENHGFDEVYGKEDIKMLVGKDLPESKWGIYDDVTLDLVFSKFESLSKSSQPFGLFSLTLDTHPPSGHETPACKELKYADGKNRMLNSVYCADYLVTKFVRKVRSSQYFENTILVIASDHLMMNSDATSLLNEISEEPRENLFMVFDNSRSPRVVKRQGTTLDVGPTLLNIMGYGSNKFGFGRDLLGSERTLVEQYGFDAFAYNLQGWRIALWDLWTPKVGSQSAPKG